MPGSPTALTTNQIHPGEPMLSLILFTKHGGEFAARILGGTEAAAQEGSAASTGGIFPKPAQMEPPSFSLSYPMHASPSLRPTGHTQSAESACNWFRRVG